VTRRRVHLENKLGLLLSNGRAGFAKLKSGRPQPV